MGFERDRLSDLFLDLAYGKSHRLKCPHCGKAKATDKTMGVTIDHDGHGIAHCFRCGMVETFHSEQNQTHITPPPRPPRVQVEKVEPTHDGLSDWALALWQSTQPITAADTAGQYLQSRRCVLPPRGSHLRWHPSLKHPSGYQGAALVGLLTDTRTTAPKSLHRTWIQSDGKKADLDPPRLLLGGHIKAGTVCRLWPDDEVTMGLAVGEGIETALSLAHAYTPVWSCVDAGNLAELPYLNGIESLLIARDRDPAGERAALTCAARWSAAGAAVRITRQRQNDINDAIQEG